MSVRGYVTVRTEDRDGALLPEMRAHVEHLHGSLVGEWEHVEELDDGTHLWKIEVAA